MQRLIFILGGIYDAAFAVMILFFPRPIFHLLSIPYPEPSVYLKLCGIFLAMLAWIYFLYVKSPLRYAGLVPVVILGRTCGALLFGFGIPVWHLPLVFLLFAGGDFIIASLHTMAVFWDR
ncbi:MAG TPA: hypothetical protein PK014_00735 [Thermoanaerobaculia bacterium]|nr:hypothetical protein [Thermoanaerobaculia bacterium]HUM29694.1 hypothetical protein [Thermoanaerobaculia bacterium]HXK66994.1 hypothetical protein [Thermoanaerobaculia bacterium]